MASEDKPENQANGLIAPETDVVRLCSKQTYTKCPMAHLLWGCLELRFGGYSRRIPYSSASDGGEKLTVALRLVLDS